jgi:hypothetical protein
MTSVPPPPITFEATDVFSKKLGKISLGTAPPNHYTFELSTTSNIKTAAK